MVSNNYSSVITALVFASCLLGFTSSLGIQGSNLIPNSPANPNNNQVIDVGLVLNRLDQLQAEMNLQKTEINLQKTEINELKKENTELKEKLLRDELPSNKEFLIARSCYELKAMSPDAQTGLHYIDPDGQINGEDPIQVYCDMTTRTTYVFHDSQDKTDVTSCADPGCYTKQIKYNGTMRQLTLMADISTSCQQSFRFDSLSVPLEFNSTQYGYWNDRNGAKQTFWAGPATSSHICQCGIDKRCLETNYNCNADTLAPIEVVDEGYITATNVLPVTRLSFGRTSFPGVKASYTLGRFECTGQAPVSNKPGNCLDLFKIGHTLSGFYQIKSSSTKIATTYCDFSKAPTDSGYETRIGINDIITSPVQFYVQRSTNWATINSNIQFELERLNVGGAMNLASGVFTAPKAGTYSFAFSAVGNGGNVGNAYVNMRLNGNSIGNGDSYVTGSAGGILTGSIHAILKLKVGDQITLFLQGGSLYDTSSGHRTHFTGILLEEDLVIS